MARFILVITLFRRHRYRRPQRGDIQRRRRPVPAHVSAERLSGGEHHAARVAPVGVRRGAAAFAGARAEQEVEAVGAHPRPAVAGSVAAERLERGEAPAAGAAPERPRVVSSEPLAAALGDHLARRRQRQREQQQEAVRRARCRRVSCCGHVAH